MVRKAFYSFHYEPDCWRVSQVRNIGAIEDNKPCSDNDWESVTKKGDAAIQEWIDAQLKGRSCAVVLIGENTAGRKWINYEIEKAWSDGKGIVGVHIHNLKDSQGNQSGKGANPFKDIVVGDDKLADSVKTYNPPFSESTDVYDHIKANLEDWVEEAITIRGEKATWQGLAEGGTKSGSGAVQTSSLAHARTPRPPDPPSRPPGPQQPPRPPRDRPVG